MTERLQKLLRDFKPVFGDEECRRIADLSRRYDSLLEKVDRKGWTFDKKADKKAADRELERVYNSLVWALEQFNKKKT